MRKALGVVAWVVVSALWLAATAAVFAGCGVVDGGVR